VKKSFWRHYSLPTGFQIKKWKGSFLSLHLLGVIEMIDLARFIDFLEKTRDFYRAGSKLAKRKNIRLGIFSFSLKIFWGSFCCLRL